MSGRYLFREVTGRRRTGARHAPLPRETGPGGMIIERDVPVVVRGGVTIYADVFRPAGDGQLPR